jgi:serine/threonine protein kinase
LTSNVPSSVVESAYLVKRAENFTLHDAGNIMLGDFGQAWRPISTTVPGEDLCIPFPARCPEALFEPEKPISYPSDIWSLACAIWEILGVRPLFTDVAGAAQDEVVAQQLDALGDHNFPDTWRDEWERDDSGTECSPSTASSPPGSPRRWRRRNRWSTKPLNRDSKNACKFGGRSSIWCPSRRTRRRRFWN